MKTIIALAAIVASVAFSSSQSQASLSSFFSSGGYYDNQDNGTSILRGGSPATGDYMY